MEFLILYFVSVFLIVRFVGQNSFDDDYDQCEFSREQEEKYWNKEIV
jgi:hypothetical protein